MTAELFPSILRRCARDCGGARGATSTPTIEVPPGFARAPEVKSSVSAKHALHTRSRPRLAATLGHPRHTLGGSPSLRTASPRERPRSRFELNRDIFHSATAKPTGKATVTRGLAPTPLGVR
jgi:hypothetical protein